jgi:hypothetical protein
MESKGTGQYFDFWAFAISSSVFAMRITGRGGFPFSIDTTQAPMILLVLRSEKSRAVTMPPLWERAFVISSDALPMNVFNALPAKGSAKFSLRSSLLIFVPGHTWRQRPQFEQMLLLTCGKRFPQIVSLKLMAFLVHTEKHAPQLLQRCCATTFSTLLD